VVILLTRVVRERVDHCQANGCQSDLRNPHWQDLSELELPTKVKYVANAMTVIRAGQQNYFKVPASQRSLGTLKES